ncbi:MAG: hypothetical protein AABZ29_02295 [Gemmatimonadota bacterium]
MRRSLLVSTIALTLAACALGAQQAGASADTSSLPAGFGTLRQDDIAVRVQFNALQVRALPLDETVIRTLSPDSYRALHELRESKRALVDSVLKRTGMPGASLWYVQFFNSEQGEARFSPLEVVINSAGRDFRALDVFALTPGFGEQRLVQREVQAGLYVFDPSVDVNQPLVITFETRRSDAWGALLKRVDRERSLIRSRAAPKP